MQSIYPLENRTLSRVKIANLMERSTSAFGNPGAASCTPRLKAFITESNNESRGTGQSWPVIDIMTSISSVCVVIVSRRVSGLLVLKFFLTQALKEALSCGRVQYQRLV